MPRVAKEKSPSVKERSIQSVRPVEKGEPQSVKEKSPFVKERNMQSVRPAVKAEPQTAGETAPRKKKKSSVPTQKSLKNLALYMKQLEKENSILARELVEKKERRLKLPIINPEENRLAMARLNLQITETESLMANQKQNLSNIKGIISSQERRMKEITDKIAELQEDLDKKIVQPGEAKVQLEDLLSELKRLRMRREKTLAGLAV